MAAGKATDALAQALTILGTAEQLWEQRLLAEKATKDVPIQVTVTKQYKQGATTVDADPKDEVIAVHRFITAPATVGVSMGMTLNIGNYESARVDVTVTVPCYKEEIESAYEWAKEFAESRVKAESADVRSAMKNHSPF